MAALFTKNTGVEWAQGEDGEPHFRKKTKWACHSNRVTTPGRRGSGEQAL